LPGEVKENEVDSVRREELLAFEERLHSGKKESWLAALVVPSSPTAPTGPPCWARAGTEGAHNKDSGGESEIAHNTLLNDLERTKTEACRTLRSTRAETKYTRHVIGGA
jgi:hypothetical protein